MRNIFLLFLLANFFLLNAQQPERLKDSIKKYQFLDPNLAIQFGMKYVELRDGDVPDIEMVATYAKIGEVLLYMELYSSALDYFNSAIRIRRALGLKKRVKVSPPILHG